MVIDRVGILTEVLGGVDVTVWRVTRYANDTGTCLWCSTGTLVMVPDDDALDWYCQASDAEALTARIEPAVTAAITAARLRSDAIAEGARATLDALSPAARELLRLADALRREGYEEGLAAARRLFTTVVRGRFGHLPPPVEQRIAGAGFADLERWSERVAKAQSPFLVVA
ncbi:MAG: hypothetical protein R3F65_30285 [bacterium]